MPFTPRPRFLWHLRSRSLELGASTRIMGILNVTPDSFSDGGHFFPQTAAIDRALEMLDTGADLIDIGGESTRPASTPVTAAEEQARILPVIRSILTARPTAILSVDTYHSRTARVAIGAGAEIVNDVSGHLWDPAMSSTCAALACGNVLMHTRGRPSEWKTQPPLAPHQVVPLVLHDLHDRADAALAAGIAHNTIVLDPGFGFGKIMDENLPLLNHFDQFHSLGFPLLAGLSRKSFLALSNPRADQKPDLEIATSAANLAAILAGAHILRVHEVAPALQVADLADLLMARW